MYATPLAFRQLEQRNAQLPSRGQGTGMGYPAGSNAAFEAWVALPEVRAALNVSGVFPDDAEWGGTAWEYPCEPLSRAHGTAELRAACCCVALAHPHGSRGAVNNDIGWLADGQPDPAVGGKSVDLRPLYAELSEQLRVIVYNGDVDGQ